MLNEYFVSSRRPSTLADMMRNFPVGGHQPSVTTSNNPARVVAKVDESGEHQRVITAENERKLKRNDSASSSLPYRRKVKKGPLGHVKSLDDFNDKKDPPKNIRKTTANKINLSRDNIRRSLLQRQERFRNSKNTKNLKTDPESEVYFADVSSCMSMRPGSEDVSMYYSDPTHSGSQHYSQFYNDDSGAYIDNPAASSHLYEPVDVEEEQNSHHTSDDTMIVHTSSPSELSDDCNPYSVIAQGPETDIINGTNLPICQSRDPEVFLPVIPNHPSNIVSGSSFASNDPLRVNANSENDVSDMVYDIIANNDNEYTNNLPDWPNASARPSNLESDLHLPLSPVLQEHHQAFNHQLSHARPMPQKPVDKSSESKFFSRKYPSKKHKKTLPLQNVTSPIHSSSVPSKIISSTAKTDRKSAKLNKRIHNSDQTTPANRSDLNGNVGTSLNSVDETNSPERTWDVAHENIPISDRKRVSSPEMQPKQNSYQDFSRNTNDRRRHTKKKSKLRAERSAKIQGESSQDCRPEEKNGRSGKSSRSSDTNLRSVSNPNTPIKSHKRSRRFKSVDKSTESVAGAKTPENEAKEMADKNKNISHLLQNLQSVNV